MKFQVQAVALLAALVGIVSADRLEVWSNCGIFGCTRGGTWYNNNSDYFYVNAQNGCGRPDIPYFNNICYDWGAKRGHFDVQGQGKRCFVQVSEYGYYCVTGTCYTTWFHETGCNWRLADVPLDANSTAVADASVPAAKPTVVASTFNA